MTLKYLLVFGFLLYAQKASAGATDLQSELYASGVINDYADKVLSMVRPAMVRNGFDPFKIENISQDFWFKLLFVNYTGHIDLENGYLQDLSTIHRYGDAKIKYEKKMLTISVDLVVDSLMSHFDYKLKIFNIGPAGKLSASLRRQVVRFGLLIDFERLTFHLQQFAFTSNDQVKLKFTGLGLADPLVGIIVDILTAIFKDYVTNSIGCQIRSAIEELIEKLPPLLPPAPNEPVNDNFMAALDALLAKISNMNEVRELDADFYDDDYSYEAIL